MSATLPSSCPMAPNLGEDAGVAAVFVYGTLMPGHVRWPLVERFVTTRVEAAVAGRLYDTGFDYPAARFDEPGRIDGWLLELVPGVESEARAELDRIEGPGYRAVSVRTLEGADATAYEWRGPVDGMVALGSGWTGV